jgi:predicted hotdog family 3-hydroxylacyl-ACP dehydratase
MSEYPAIAELVPHSGPMVLLDAMTHWAPGQATCVMRVRAGMPFVKGDALDTVALMEPMAQAVAACLGYEAFQGGEGVRVGMIIGCRKFQLELPSLDVGDELTISASRIRGSDTLSHFECETRRGEQLVATATLTLYHAEKPPA